MKKNLQFGTGGKKSPADKRDYKWSKLGKSAIPFSWSLGYDVTTKLPQDLKVKDQNGSSSCGGQATAYYGEVLEAVATKSQEERSAKFIYAQTFIGAGGSYLRDNFDIAVKQGWARESVLPSYNNGQPPSEVFITNKADITKEVIEDASSAKALSYALVANDIDAVAQAVANNYGAVILVQGSNNGTWLSAYPKVGNAEWNHFMYVGKAKLIDGKKHLGCLNSWGVNVGLNGWQWISEDFFTQKRILEVRTLVYKDKPAQFKFNKNLYFGMRNGDVLQLQARLGVLQTGLFWTQTLASLIKWQKRNGIPGTGFFGSLSRAKMNELSV